jgi:hypothetical protein
MIISGFGVIVAMVAQSGSTQWNLVTPSKGAHAVLGIIALIWALFQGILGVVTRVCWNLEFRKRSTLPEASFFPDKIHWFSGYFLPVIGFVNVFLGLYDWGVNRTWMGLWGGWCGMVLVAFMVLEIRKRRKDKGMEQDIEQYYSKSVPLGSLPATKPTSEELTFGSSLP